MIALQITDIKKMMQALLYSASFDSFSLQEVSVTKDISFFLEGRLHPEYYTSEDRSADPELDARTFATWGQYRDLTAAFIRGEKSPLSFKLVLQASDSYMQKLLKNPEFTADPALAKALVLTFRYENGALTCLTGTAFTTFVPDKSLDKLWDNAIRKSLDHMEISFEEM